MSANDLISYHDGIFMPALIVTGDMGALGKIHFIPGRSLCVAMSSGRKDHPAPESPNPCAKMQTAVAGFVRAGIVIADILTGPFTVADELSRKNATRTIRAQKRRAR